MAGEGLDIHVPERGKWIESQKIEADFHPDPSKEGDPVEDLLRKHGPEGAVAELESKLRENPGDEEARRQLNLIHNRLQDLVSRVGGIVGH